ncbi:hypothetical protein N825_25835 [Skermanella stibiiresistens SB22]|uniref:Tyrosine specific protein phosphatases domain-containing protein n=1 Tax=Skermanella stibiiresistens SB22 TaxID=1385369 RepID=W9GSD8_9PROT|nr:protein-tyrosine-phosphatase [Skermanella stibiiresistens]EWY36644.1 hypothetical protein N825_25835 [Skermanella stibiiresistens SB22]
MTTEIETPLLPYRITICGLDELAGHAQAGFTHVVSILDPERADPQDFTAYAPHRRVLWRFDDTVRTNPGMTVPCERDVRKILSLGEELLAEKADQLLIHCHAGVSRSTATAVILMAQNNPGRESDVFRELTRVRPRSWPNSLMVGIADEILGRSGALVRELRAHHAKVAAAYPDLAEQIGRHGRAHELPTA